MIEAVADSVMVGDVSFGGGSSSIKETSSSEEEVEILR